MDVGSEEKKVKGHIHGTQSGTEEENTHSSAALCYVFLNGPPTPDAALLPQGLGVVASDNWLNYS